MAAQQKLDCHYFYGNPSKMLKVSKAMKELPSDDITLAESKVIFRKTFDFRPTVATLNNFKNTIIKMKSEFLQNDDLNSKNPIMALIYLLIISQLDLSFSKSGCSLFRARKVFRTIFKCGDHVKEQYAKQLRRMLGQVAFINNLKIVRKQIKHRKINKRDFIDETEARLQRVLKKFLKFATNKQQTVRLDERLDEPSTSSATRKQQPTVRPLDEPSTSSASADESTANNM